MFACAFTFLEKALEPFLVKQRGKRILKATCSRGQERSSTKRAPGQPKTVTFKTCLIWHACLTTNQPSVTACGRPGGRFFSVYLRVKRGPATALGRSAVAEPPAPCVTRLCAALTPRCCVLSRRPQEGCWLCHRVVGLQGLESAACAEIFPALPSCTCVRAARARVQRRTIVHGSLPQIQQLPTGARSRRHFQTTGIVPEGPPRALPDPASRPPPRTCTENVAAGARRGTFPQLCTGGDHDPPPCTPTPPLHRHHPTVDMADESTPHRRSAVAAPIGCCCCRICCCTYIVGMILFTPTSCSIRHLRRHRCTLPSYHHLLHASCSPQMVCVCVARFP